MSILQLRVSDQIKLAELWVPGVEEADLQGGDILVVGRLAEAVVFDQIDLDS